ncbi:MAG: ImmA/IrrE family metallo-endopeptidase, partial [Lactobacillus sp.]|nr:ImmA/IrrE family metallo-endopeptidase [Lactobacillus sp.]
MSFFINHEFKKIKSKYELHTPKQLISDAGIKLLQFELDDVTGGFTVTNNRCSTIVINSNWDKNYLNFVILHEYAHIRLHDGASTPFYRHTGTDINIPKIEREANELAMKLLIGMQDRDEIM